MLNDNALCTVETVKLYIGNTDPANDSKIELAINILSRAFDDMVGYRLIQADYPNTILDGAGNRILRFPVHNISACSRIEYRSTEYGWCELPTHFYELDTVGKRGVIGTGSFFFSAGIRNWRASFTGGWERSQLPGIILESFLYEMKRFLELRPDVLSENLGGQSMSGRTFLPLRHATETALSGYRIPSI